MGNRHLVSLLTITALIKYFFTFFRLYKSLLPVFGIIYFLFIILPFLPPLVWGLSIFCQMGFISELLTIEFSFGYPNATSCTSASRKRMTDSYVEICKELMTDHNVSQGGIKEWKVEGKDRRGRWSNTRLHSGERWKATISSSPSPPMLLVSHE